MALLLARRGARVSLLERRADPRHSPPEQGRSINLALAARGLVSLELAKLTDRISPHWVRMRGRMLHTEQGMQRLLPYGTRAHEVLYSISRSLLNRLLVEAAAEQPSIELRFSARCVDVDPERRVVELSDESTGRGEQLPFTALIGADGAGSAVREALQRRGLTHAQEEPLAHDYKELMIAARAGPVPAYAFEPHALHIWPRGTHMLIALPNADASFTATLFLAREGQPSFQQLHDDHAVQRFFAAEFPDAAQMIADLTQQFAVNPQARLATLHCERWSTHSVLLLGDAAHAIVPFHGQGLNCGFEDCRLLDELLAKAPVEQAFDRFERARRPDTDAIAAMALENYLEMRSEVRSPEFVARRTLAAELERTFPERFIPRYSMVMFHPEIGYARARELGERQARLLQRLTARCGAGALEGERLACARTLLDESGL
jgi:kynurenine 3-monooxygenase